MRTSLALWVVVLGVVRATQAGDMGVSPAAEPAATGVVVDLQRAVQALNQLMDGQDLSDDAELEKLLKAYENPEAEAWLKTLMGDGDMARGLSEPELVSQVEGLVRRLQWSVPAVSIAVLLVGMAMARCLFGIAVFVDARRLRGRGQTVVIMPPVLWSLGVLMGGMLVVGLYWLMHHSSIRAR